MGKMTSKLAIGHQSQYAAQNIYNTSILNYIDPSVQLHGAALTNPLSSAAACLNVLGSMSQSPNELLVYLNALGLPITRIIPFPSGASVGGRVYKDQGYVIFEWVGPQKSPIMEKGGKRGSNRTSIDAFILAEIDNKITQVLIEWKFTEGNSRPIALERFSGLKGVERLRRYSSVLAKMRRNGNFPFEFEEECGIGLYDFSADHVLQLLRMTLLAKTTTPCTIGNVMVEDYRIVHLSHSQNNDINILHDKYLSHSPGLRKYLGGNYQLHDAWKDILSLQEKSKFIGAYWDTALSSIKDQNLKAYLQSRY